jgi:hypothetical protein
MSITVTVDGTTYHAEEHITMVDGVVYLDGKPASADDEVTTEYISIEHPESDSRPLTIIEWSILAGIFLMVPATILFGYLFL